MKTTSCPVDLHRFPLADLLLHCQLSATELRHLDRVVKAVSQGMPASARNIAEVDLGICL